ncbi:MAG TPA: GNAT family N-acetyltransferase, partial [Actinomycetota bacterium]|nr:GNAT family N-acetyltransferase [Actinomycetota bacterium]
MTTGPTADFIESHTTTVTLKDGTRMLVRPIVPDDKQLLLDGFSHLSSETRFRRFLGYMDKLRPPLLRYLTEIDYVDHFAWIGLDADTGAGIGVARYVRMRDDPTAAESAIVVVDAYHRRGAGTILLQLLGASALSNGITHFVGEALAQNQPIRDLLVNLGARVFEADAGEVGFEVDLPSTEDSFKGTALYRALRAAAEGKVTQVLPESHLTDDDAAKVKKHRA